jgi:hypothetical protein
MISQYRSMDMLMGRISRELGAVPALHPKLALREHELRYLGFFDDDDDQVVQQVVVAPQLQAVPHAPAVNGQ